MTKKQLNALDRIVARSGQRISDPPGARPIDDAGEIRYFVTDGVTAVVFDEKLNDLEPSPSSQSVFSLIKKEQIDGRHTLALTVTTDLLKEWKRMAKAWDKAKETDRENFLVKIPFADDSTEVGFYDPHLLVDTAEAVGAGAMIYIGRSPSFRHNTLFVYPKDWMALSNYTFGYVLPWRKRG